MSDKRLVTGQLGEKIAIKHLNKLGYDIVGTNYRCHLGELDIIAREGTCLVFIEVRTKTGKRFGQAIEAMTKNKIKRLKRLSQYYMQHKYRREVLCRLDFIALQLNGENYSVERIDHIKGI